MLILDPANFDDDYLLSDQTGSKINRIPDQTGYKTKSIFPLTPSSLPHGTDYFPKVLQLVVTGRAIAKKFRYFRYDKATLAKANSMD